MSLFSTIRKCQAGVVIAFALVCNAFAADKGAGSPYAQWSNGPSASPDFFPIGVWLQNPTNAPQFKAAGFNLYIGLWEGPTQAQLDALGKAGMPVICEQNKVGLQNRSNHIIVGWLQGDEPDNSQWAGRFGLPMSTEKVRRYYEAMRAADPSRPIVLTLGQAVAWDPFIGRGLRRNHPEDYLEYVRGCDIASFDIYPVTHPSPEVAGKLEFVANGVQRLRKWNAGKPVWNCIECTHIYNPNAKATPAQVRSEVWMSLIHGSQGLIYFVHQFKPVFREPALLDDAEMLAAVTALNRQITELAPVLNSPTIADGATIQSSVTAAPIAGMLKRYDGAAYLFTVCMRNAVAQGRFKIADLAKDSSAEVLGEARNIAVKDGEFVDDFKPYEAHLYRIKRTP